MFAQRRNQRLFRWGYFDFLRSQPFLQPDRFAPEILLAIRIRRVLLQAAVAQLIRDRAPAPSLGITAL